MQGQRLEVIRVSRHIVQFDFDGGGFVQAYSGLRMVSPTGSEIMSADVSNMSQIHIPPIFDFPVQEIVLSTSLLRVIFADAHEICLYRISDEVEVGLMSNDGIISRVD